MSSLTSDDIRVLTSLIRSGQLPVNTARRLVATGVSAAAEDMLASIDHLVDLAGLGGGDSISVDATLLATPVTTGAGTLLDEPATARADVQRGSVLPGFDRYTLIELLGRGGMGEVWLAEDRVLGRRVALKVLLQQMNARLEVVKRFVYEARATGILEHPGVIPVHDAGSLEDGRWFYTMPRVGGRNLNDILRDLRRGDAQRVHAWPLQRLLDVFSRVCLTVAYAHAHGFIHRDLKPENILLGSFGEVYVADWGLAKCFDDRLAGVTIGVDPDRDVPQGAVLGTPGYMSPEQLCGDLAHLGPAADCYSLACILYEILTLRLPFEETNVMALAVRVMREHAPDPLSVAGDRDVPWKMAQLALEGLEREPTARPDARDFASRVASFLDGVEEQRRRAELAEERLDEALRLRERYDLAREALDERERAAHDRDHALTLEAPLDQRIDVWRDQHVIDGERRELDDLFALTVQAASHSLGYRDSRLAHALLADMYARRVLDAEATHDATGQQYFRALLREHDSGTWAELLSDTGTARIDAWPPTASVRVVRQVPMGPIHSEHDITWAPGDPLPVGSYIAIASSRGFVSANVPFVVRGATETQVTIRLPRSFPGSEEFAWVEGGSVSLGGDPDARSALPRQTVDVAPFLLGRYPVTMGQYVEFLNDLARTDMDAACAHAPRTTDGALWVRVDRDARSFAIIDVDEQGDQWDERWPALMVSWHDAVAWCAWRSARDGATYRLPTEFEWEKAARGADGRYFPWGNGFDPTLCRMADSTQGRAKPVPVGSYPYDQSPYGICDMAGLAIEWTATVDPADPSRRIMRGGGVFSPPPWCRAASRKSNDANTFFVQFGFRVVREVDPT